MFSIIVAADECGAIGYKGQMPWHLPADLRYFKEITMGHPVIMGRKTYEAIGRPLPGRRNLVVSRQPGLRIEGCKVYSSIENAAEQVIHDDAFIIGGAQIYQQSWELADRIYLTRVHTRLSDFDATMPEIKPREWRLVQSTEYPADEKNAYAMTFEVYNRKF